MSTTKSLYFVLFLAIFTVSNVLNAQSNRPDLKKPRPNVVYKKGDITLSAAVGVLPGLVPVGKKAITMPLSVRAEYRLTKHISLGAYAGYASVVSKPIIQSDGILTQYQNNSLKVAGRMTIYKSFDKLNFYGGAMLGINRDDITEMQVIDQWREPIQISGRVKDRSNESGVSPYLSGFVGISYYVLRNKAVFAEVGSDVSLLNVGIRFKL